MATDSIVVQNIQQKEELLVELIGDAELELSNIKPKSIMRYR